MDKDRLIRSGSQYYSQAAGHAGSFLKPGPCFKGRPHRVLSTYLGQELGGVLAIPLEGASEDTVDGSASQEVSCAVKRGVKGCSVQGCTDQS